MGPRSSTRRNVHTDFDFNRQRDSAASMRSANEKLCGDAVGGLQYTWVMVLLGYGVLQVPGQGETRRLNRLNPLHNVVTR